MHMFSQSMSPDFMHRRDFDMAFQNLPTGRQREQLAGYKEDTQTKSRNKMY